MCVIFFIVGHPKYKLVIAANRDEFLDRPTDRAHFWEGAPHVIAGIDRAAEHNYKGLAFKFGQGNHNQPSANESQVSPDSARSSSGDPIRHTASEKIVISSRTPTGRLFDLMHENNDTMSVCSDTSQFSRSPSPVSQPSPQIGTATPVAGHGTWIGMTRTGRFSFITNVLQHPSELIPDGLSRGFLVRDYLLEANHPHGSTPKSTRRFAKKLNKMRKRFNGFNLVAGRIGEETWYIGNRARHADHQSSSTRPLQENKVYGIANAQCIEEGDSISWPKVSKGSELFEQALNESQNENELCDKLLELLSNSESFQETLPSTQNLSNITHETYKESRRLTPICIEKESSLVSNYGTRTHTVIIVDNENNALFVEVDRYKEHDISKEELSSHGMAVLKELTNESGRKLSPLVNYVRGEYKNVFRFKVEEETILQSRPHEHSTSRKNGEDVVGIVSMEED